MRALLVLTIVLSACGVFAEDRVFTKEDLTRYQDGNSSSDASASASQAEDNAADTRSDAKADARREKMRAAEERRNQLADCLQQKDRDYKLEWERICRSDNKPPGCLLAPYKKRELQRHRDTGKKDCRRQFSRKSVRRP